MGKDSSSVYRTTLENGLEVRLKEIHTSPLISNWLWYRVGSRNEIPGCTGISHWVEHMQFKGTPTFPAGVLDKAISRDGGLWNAFTYLDWTTYFETMPADCINLGLELEADRMVNSVFDPQEVASERTVIISERQGHENEPTFRLSEELRGAAFRVHSYHHEIVGDMVDLEQMTRADLYAHYRRYYVPGNAILALAGDFDSTEMLKRVEDYFGKVSASSTVDFATRREPEQHGEKRVEVHGPGETAFLQVAYHAPQAKEEDYLTLSVLDSVLTGPTNLNLMGSGISNRTSRFYQRVVKGGLAASIGGSLPATADPFLYTLSATVRPDSSPEAVLKSIDEGIAEILDNPIAMEEVEKAIKQARALFAYGSESITNQGFWLGYADMFADYAWFETYLERLQQVTPAMILETARTYLIPANRTVGTYYPDGEGGHA